MKSKMKTCFAMAAAGALMALSTSALAQEGKSSRIKLSDAELDEVTAGQGATSEVVIFNPGKGPGVLKINNHHGTCINCIPLDVPRTSGAVLVTLPTGDVILRFVRQSPF